MEQNFDSEMQEVLKKYKINKGVFVELDNVEALLFTLVYNCENTTLKIMPHGDVNINDIKKFITILYTYPTKEINEKQ